MFTEEMTCSCGGSVELVLTQEDDFSETLGMECIECGADFNDPNEEIEVGEGGVRLVPREP